MQSLIKPLLIIIPLSVLSIAGVLLCYKFVFLSKTHCTSLSSLSSNKFGLHTSSFGPFLLVRSSVPGQRSFYAHVSDYDRVKNSTNTVTEFATQSGIMDYYLGYFDSWQSIPDSTDKIMLVKDSPQSRPLGFRVAFQDNPSWEDNPTVIRFFSQDAKGILLSDLVSAGKLNQIKKNDVVSLSPGYFLTEFQKRDSDGRFWVSEIIDYVCLK